MCLRLPPDTGKIKWSFDPHTVLKGLTQGGMKSRGVAYWQADNPASGQPCQKIVYTYTREAFPQDWAMTQNNLGNAYVTASRAAGRRTSKPRSRPLRRP